MNIAQVLVTKPDFYNPISRVNLRTTFSELLALNIVPIVNTNDAVVSPSMPDFEVAPGSGANLELPPEQPGVSICSRSCLKTNICRATQIVIHDNDSLAAHLAVEVGAELLILMSDVNGVYNLPPAMEGSKLLHTYSPKHHGMVQFGKQSKVGTGGMESKVFSAAWALERGVSVVICNGTEEQSISRIIQGKQVGTFFTDAKQENLAVEALAGEGTHEVTSACVTDLANVRFQHAKEVESCNR